VPRASDQEAAFVREALEQANALREVRDFECAIHVLVQALSHGIETARIYCGLGNVYVDSDDLERAENAYKRALDVEPNFANAMHNLAVIYRRQNRYSLYVRTYKKAQRLSSKPRPEDARSGGATRGRRTRASLFGWLLGGAIVVAALVWLLIH